MVWKPLLSVTRWGIESGVFDPPLPKWKTNSLRGRSQGCVWKRYSCASVTMKKASRKDASTAPDTL